jgi:hypothetical protein
MQQYAAKILAGSVHLWTPGDVGKTLGSAPAAAVKDFQKLLQQEWPVRIEFNGGFKGSAELTTETMRMRHTRCASGLVVRRGLAES